MRIKAISFDLDGTLVDFSAGMRKALSRVLDVLKSDISGVNLTVDDLIRIRDQVAAHMITASLEDIREEAFRATLEHLECPNPKLARYLTDIYWDARYRETPLFPDVTETLKALSPSYQLGIISNGNSYPNKSGLAGYFSAQVFAQGNYRKPDSRLFLDFCHQVSCHPGEILHVGDAPINDVWGAQRVGMRTLWLNRAKIPNTSSVIPDWETDALSDLNEICRQLSSP